MRNEHGRREQQSSPILKRFSHAGWAAASLLLVGVLSLLIIPDPFVNAILVPRLIRTFEEAYPGYSLRLAGLHYSVLGNLAKCDSVVVAAVDDNGTVVVHEFSLRGFDRWALFRGGTRDDRTWRDVIVDAGAMDLVRPRADWAIHCGRVHLSIPDSILEADTLDYHPRTGDNEFFDASQFRRTRVMVAASHVELRGVSWLEFLRGTGVRARSVRVQGASVDILCNKEKPVARTDTPGWMPGEMLASLPGNSRIDSVNVMNAKVQYGERWTAAAQPALVELDDFRLSAAGISNESAAGPPLVLRAGGTLMNSGTMSMVITIPINPTESPLLCSGSLGPMDLRVLNRFLETAEQVRITAGVLQDASFEFAIVSGRGGGTVRAVYRDFQIAKINRVTRNAGGTDDVIVSFLANTFKLRGSNEVDGSGGMKIGTVMYVRKQGDSFFHLLWFSLRSGIKDVAGF
jgi:hypothetical protein